MASGLQAAGRTALFCNLLSHFLKSLGETQKMTQCHFRIILHNRQEDVINVPKVTQLICSKIEPEPLWNKPGI